MACAYTTRTRIRVVRAASAPAAASRPTASRGVQYTYEGLFTVVGCGRYADPQLHPHKRHERTSPVHALLCLWHHPHKWCSEPFRPRIC